MDWKTYIADMNGALGSLRKTTPEVTSSFSKLAQAAEGGEALDAKTRELLATTIAVALRCEPCIAYHAKALVKVGATREELAEALGMVVYMGGGPGLMYAAKTLQAFDQFSED